MSEKIAIISPWPPQHTGIADYAYDFVCGLVKQGHNVTVITEVVNPEEVAGVEFFPPDWLTEETRKQFSQLVYHIGNNSRFHIFQIALLLRYSGTVHLHDMVLHHLMGWLLYVHGSPELYRKVLAKWYGPCISEKAWGSLKKGHGIWNRSEVVDVPFFEEVIQHANGVIVHSQFAASKVQQAFPGAPIKIIPQLYLSSFESPRKKNKTFCIGVFGGVDPNKRLDVVVSAAREALEAGALIELHIAGNIHPDCQFLIDDIKKSPLANVIHVHGRVEHEKFQQLISEMDLCVSLRYPTMGETSAVVMRSLQAGIPVVVNKVGWYAELPDFIPKLDPNSADEVTRLSALLVSFSSKGKVYDDLLNKTQKWRDTELKFDSMVKEYVDFVLSLGEEC